MRPAEAEPPLALAPLLVSLTILLSPPSLALPLCSYVSYTVFELPLQLVTKKIGPGKTLPALAFLFGLFSLCMGFVQNYGQAIGVRFRESLFSTRRALRRPVVELVVVEAAGSPPRSRSSPLSYPDALTLLPRSSRSRRILYIPWTGVLPVALLCVTVLAVTSRLEKAGLTSSPRSQTARTSSASASRATSSARLRLEVSAASSRAGSSSSTRLGRTGHGGASLPLLLAQQRP